MESKLKKHQRVEILAPAGSFIGLKAALNASCDGIYIGGSQFGARAYAQNLSKEELLKGIDLVHIHEKKIYLTINTLLKEEEIKTMLFSYLLPFYEQGLDAVIVQDLGVAKFIHDHFPELPIHGSTQMTLTDSTGVSLLKKVGITRIVPARELGLEEIKKMKQESGLEIETFVHGALCYSYSGQCLLSSVIGGRSGNRGRCAQPCRMPYSLKEAKTEGYLLSPRDICTLDLIPELVEAGVDSFKIEGRMKRPEYTALCTHLYQKYTYLYLEKGQEGYGEYIKKNKKEYQKDKRDLMDVYNRGGFSKGYYTHYHGIKQMSIKRPNHFGVLVGEVAFVKGNQAGFVLKEEINPQDVLEFRNKEEESLYEYTVGEKGNKGDTIWANFKSGSKILVGNQVYRRKNHNLLQKIEENFIKEDKRVSIQGNFQCIEGVPVSLKIRRKEAEITVFGEEITPAKNQPITQGQILSAMGQLKDTHYQWESFEVDVGENTFLPMGKIKNLRREGLRIFEERILESYKRKTPQRKKKDSSNQCDSLCNQGNPISIQVSVCKESQLKAALECSYIRRIYVSNEILLSKEFVEKAHKVGKEMYHSMPYIFRRKTFDSYENNNYLEVDGYLIRTLEEAVYIKEKHKKKAIVLDSNLYTFNQYAKDFWKEEGIDEYTTPVELNEREIETHGTLGDILIVYGHLPLMISVQCLANNYMSCYKTPGIFHLYDRKKKEFIVKNQCKECYNIIYDGTALSLLGEEKRIKNLGFSAIRMDFTIEGEEQTRDIINKFCSVFCEKEAIKRTDEGINILENTTKGHFRQGVQ